MYEVAERNILRIKRHKYLDSDITWNDNMFRYIVMTMTMAQHAGGCECLVMVSNTSYAYEATTQMDPKHVSMTYQMQIALSSTEFNDTYTIIHNHPTDDTFSFEDIQSFIDQPRLTRALVCTNSCKYIGLMYKVSLARGFKAKLLRVLITAFKSVSKHGRTIDTHLILNILHRFGVLYREYANY